MTRRAKATGAGITASHLLMEPLANRLMKQLASGSLSYAPARGRPTGAPLLCSGPFALSGVCL